MTSVTGSSLTGGMKAAVLQGRHFEFAFKQFIEVGTIGKVQVRDYFENRFAGGTEVMFRLFHCDGRTVFEDAHTGKLADDLIDIVSGIIQLISRFRPCDTAGCHTDHGLLF